MTDGQLLTVVPSRTGEELILASAATDELADALDFLKARIKQTRELTQMLEDELSLRLKHENLRNVTVGEWTIVANSGRTREWDAEELEGVLEDLVARGVISAGAATGIIQRSLKVSGTAALRLASSLDGGDREQVERCAKWKDGRASVKVERA